jgi:putative transposase
MNCGLVMDRDDNSAVNILMRFLARLGPHTERVSVRCADVFTAIEDGFKSLEPPDVLKTFEYI